MDNIDKIKSELDGYYREYIDGKNSLSGVKTKETAKLIVGIVTSNAGNAHDVASELARFSANVVNEFFKIITDKGSLPIAILDEVLKEFLKTDIDTGKSQHYVQKFVFAISAIMNNYKEKALKSSQLSRLVVFNAQFAVKSEKHKNKFQNLINNTLGGIFMLDYSEMDKNSLQTIWNATNSIYDDLSKAKYESLIADWAEKYGFIKPKQESASKVKAEQIKPEIQAADNKTSPSECKNLTEKETSEVVSDSEKNITETVFTAKEDNNPTKKVSKIEKISETKKDDNDTSQSEKTANDKASKPSYQELIGRLYSTLRRDMSNGQETVISAVAEMLTPLGKKLEKLQGEIDRSRTVGSENVFLKSKAEEAERLLSAQKEKLSDAERYLLELRTENDELKRKLKELESKNAELDSKLDEAYAINSREASLEAEKIRSELKKSFAFLYEDWLEYEHSDVSEENYESLQAIIKKIFRSLKKGGIDFEGND